MRQYIFRAFQASSINSCIYFTHTYTSCIQHPKVQSLPFKAGVKRQDRVNARVRYIEGDITANEKIEWLKHFDSIPEMLNQEEKEEFLATLTGVSISSDAFFPFR